MNLVFSRPPWAQIDSEQSLELRILEAAFLVSTASSAFAISLGPHSLWGLPLVLCEAKAPTEVRIEMPEVRLARGRCSGMVPGTGVCGD